MELQPGHGRQPDPAHYAERLEEAALVERLGLAAVWGSEHHAVEDGHLSQQLPFLAAVAARTSRVRLGTGVLLLPLYRPRDVAEQAGVVDLVAGGRLLLGFGAGWVEREFDAYGVDRSMRGRLLEEKLTWLRRALAEGVAADGPDGTDLPVAPRSPQPGGPPLFLGGTAPRALDRVARLADGWFALGHYRWQKTADGWPALAEALRLEYEAVVRNGFVLQVDCPDLALEWHRSYHGQSEASFLGFVERIVQALNDALRNVPRDRVRMHICWGNYEGPHDCDIALETIWPVVRKARVGGYVLPFANPRHAHEINVLRRMPLADDQIIVAGVIDTLTNIVEHPEVVAERLERVAAAVGDPQRVLAGTDCGFDSTAGQGRVAEDVAFAKLRALVEGARIATQRLFPTS